MMSMGLELELKWDNSQALVKSCFRLAITSDRTRVGAWLVASVDAPPWYIQTIRNASLVLNAREYTNGVCLTQDVHLSVYSNLCNGRKILPKVVRMPGSQKCLEFPVHNYPCTHTLFLRSISYFHVSTENFSHTEKTVLLAMFVDSMKKDYKTAEENQILWSTRR